MLWHVKPWKHYPKWNDQDTKNKKTHPETNVAWFHLYEVPVIGKFL